MLARRLELADAYAELQRKLSGRAEAIRTLLGVVVSTAAFWSPAQIAEARDERLRLREVNRHFAGKARELAALVGERSELHNRSGFYRNTHYHVARVIERAAAGNGLFRFYLQKPLSQLRGQFDLKYWPRVDDFLDELARDAGEADLEASDPVMDAATMGARRSLADFFEALYAAIEENSTGNCGFIPKDLKLTDGTLALLANCALDLGPDEAVDGPYLKRFASAGGSGPNRRYAAPRETACPDCRVDNRRLVSGSSVRQPND